MEKPIVLLSGGFDPYHDGHAKMFMAAAEIGDICVILNSDEWLDKKKGNHFMSLTERADVLHSVRNVIWVWESKTMDDVSLDIEDIRKQVLFEGRTLIFGKGGDRNVANTPEQAICEKLRIPIIFGLGGNNNQSSSKLLDKWNVKNSSSQEQVNLLSKSTIDSINAWGNNNP